MGIGNWELGIGNWELGIGNCYFPGFLLPPASCLLPCSLLPPASCLRIKTTVLLLNSIVRYINNKTVVKVKFYF
ncbi:MAG: hypothetical protein F6K47_00740 [Symploca sp. SIO2E6]|nr:hypothetical protein [Symploca sp. SIO2E6]